MLALKNVNDLDRDTFLYYEGEIISVKEENELKGNEAYITKSYELSNRGMDEFIEVGDCTHRPYWDEYYHMSKSERIFFDDREIIVLCETTDVKEYVKNHPEKYSFEEMENMDDDDLSMVAYDELDSNYYENGISYSEMINYYPISGKCLSEAIEKLLNDSINIEGCKPLYAEKIIEKSIKNSINNFVNRFGKDTTKEYNIKLANKATYSYLEHKDTCYVFEVYISAFNRNIEIFYEVADYREEDTMYAKLDTVE